VASLPEVDGVWLLAYRDAWFCWKVVENGPLGRVAADGK
jgi:hypothetical protein